MVYLINKYVMCWIGIVGFIYSIILDSKKPNTFTIIMTAFSPVLFYGFLFLIILPFFIKFKILNGYLLRNFNIIKKNLIRSNDKIRPKLNINQVKKLLFNKY